MTPLLYINWGGQFVTTNDMENQLCQNQIKSEQRERTTATQEDRGIRVEGYMHTPYSKGVAVWIEKATLHWTIATYFNSIMCTCEIVYIIVYWWIRYQKK